MTFAILFLFFVLSILILFAPVQVRGKSLIWLFYFVFIGITIMRTSDMPDYENYYNYFVTGDFDRAEIGFKFYVESFKNISTNPGFLFFVVALLSVGLKCLAIRQFSPYIYGSLILYISYFFIIQDLIQIRVAIASGIFLLATKYLVQRNALKYFIASGIAILFHYSAIVLLPLWFIRPDRSNKRIYIWFIPLSYIIVMTGHSFGHLASMIPIEQIQTLWTMYEQKMINDEGVDINIFNYTHLFRCVLCMFIIYNIDRIAQYSSMAVTWTKVYTISLVAFLLLSDIPVMAFRISELLQIVEILLIPTILLIPKYRWSGKLAIIAFSGFCLFINVFYNSYVV